jgi:hypothetical protein
MELQLVMHWVKMSVEQTEFLWESVMEWPSEEN